MNKIPFTLACDLDKEHRIELAEYEFRRRKISPQECIDRNKTYIVRKGKNRIPGRPPSTIAKVEAPSISFSTAL